VRLEEVTGGLTPRIVNVRFPEGVIIFEYHEYMSGSFGLDISLEPKGEPNECVASLRFNDVPKTTARAFIKQIKDKLKSFSWEEALSIVKGLDEYSPPGVDFETHKEYQQKFTEFVKQFTQRQP